MFNDVSSSVFTAVCNFHVIIIIISRSSIAIELSLGGSSPYTGTGKTDKNKYT